MVQWTRLISCPNPKYQTRCMHFLFITVLINIFAWIIIDIFHYRMYLNVAVLCFFALLFTLGYWSYYIRERGVLHLFNIILVVIIFAFMAYSIWLCTTPQWYWAFLCFCGIYMFSWILNGTVQTYNVEVSDKN